MHSRIETALLAVCALLLSAQEAIAQGNYPQKPVRFIIPFAPGGAGDFVGRIVALKLADLLGQPMVVDNRPGASGFLGLEIGASAKPDGYTIVLGNNGAVAISPAVYTASTVRPTRDLAAITQIVDVPSALVVHPSLPVRNVKELIALAKTVQRRRRSRGDRAGFRRNAIDVYDAFVRGAVCEGAAPARTGRDIAGARRGTARRAHHDRIGNY